MASGDRVAVDSCVIVNVLTDGAGDQPDWLPHGKSLLAAGDRGELDLYISAITIAEVLACGQVRGNHLKKADRHQRIGATRQWLAENSMVTIEVDETLAAEAGRLGQSHQLTGADATVRASALRVHATALYTWDNNLLKIGDAIPGLRVVTPVDAVPGDLFSSGGL